MNSLPEMTWVLKDAVKSPDILEALSSEFDPEIIPGKTSVLQFFDDFDAHLWQENYYLCQVDKQKFQLISQAGEILEGSAKGDARFWWDFSESKVKDELQKIVGLRAILPIAAISLLESRYSLRNRDQKIVVKCRFTQAVVNDKIGQYFTLQALRGYTNYFAKAVQLLDPFIQADINDFGLRYLLLSQNIEALKAKKSAHPSLSAKMPTEQAVRAMAIAILEEARVHVDGVIADTDTEFLHQFRVNIRKLRSLISLLKKSLPAQTIDTLLPRLSAIASKTNRLRDLDVFLLAQDSYRAMLPPSFASGLNELYRLVEQQRAQERLKVSGYFPSDEYKDEVAACVAALSLNSVAPTPMALKPVLKVVKNLLLKRYHKMLLMSEAINSQSADTAIHELRIEFKKLRYMIEFFVELLHRKRTARLVGEIKKIQTVLGDFNDYCIQIDFLISYVDDSRIEMSKALSGLIAILHHRKTETRLKVSGELGKFFTEHMSIEFDLLFDAKATGVQE